MKKIDRTALLFDLTLFSSRKRDLLVILEKWLNGVDELHVIYTPNPEQIIQSRGNKEFKQVLNKADLLLPDGVGLVFASRLLSLFDKSAPLSERIAGVEVVEDLLKLARQKELKVLVIGGRSYSPADYFAHEGAKIDWTPGYKNALKPTLSEKRKLEVNIKEIQPDLVFVAFGAPTQELWIEQHRELLSKNNTKIAMAVGGSFDYLLNKVPRAPHWFRKLGLEWLFRLMVEPWRLKRQLRLVAFVVLTIKKAIEK